MHQTDERLKPITGDRTPVEVLKKLLSFAEDGDLIKIVAVALVRGSDGTGAEIIIGSDNIDRYDLLSAQQQLRVQADRFYGALVAAGEAYASGPSH